MPNAIHNVIQDTVGVYLGKEQTVWRDGILIARLSETINEEDPGHSLLCVLAYDKIETGTRPRKVIASGFKAWLVVPWTAQVDNRHQEDPLGDFFGPGAGVREVTAADLDRLSVRDLFFRVSAAFSDLDALADWAVTNIARHGLSDEFEGTVGQAVSHGGLSMYFTLYDRRKVPATAEDRRQRRRVGGVGAVAEGSILPRGNPLGEVGEVWWKHPEDEEETRKQLKEHIMRYCRMLQHYVVLDV